MLYYGISLVMGIAISMQAPINASLSRSLQASPILAALISFVIGSACLLLFACLSGELNADIFKSLLKQSWWKFLGGILGAFFVFGTILLAPKIGLINMFLLILIGQLITGMLLDNFGAFGLNIKPISWHKILGLVIVFGGLLVFFMKEIKEGLQIYS
ncbi:DMT family transporter [Helicobacter sp. MIT 11-5569]|uniref:DMT family transporter n=1 Tax=Helicobacter sp. MIT 11-5569 TaxID=1548151 RepID=UPI00068E4FA0|nr:DMT family transporter [Helicobacter sp. MIT 11-5569]TLD83175.1 DMT family transporter [Helicobacter sp. MIT 11-5569]